MQVRDFDFSSEKSLPPSLLRDNLERLVSERDKEMESLNDVVVQLKKATDMSTAVVEADMSDLLGDLNAAYSVNVCHCVNAYFDAVDASKGG